MPSTLGVEPMPIQRTVIGALRLTGSRLVLICLRRELFQILLSPSNNRGVLSGTRDWLLRARTGIAGHRTRARTSPCTCSYSRAESLAPFLAQVERRRTPAASAAAGGTSHRRPPKRCSRHRAGVLLPAG